MKYCVGIDLGSTTTKAIILGEDGEILGRGITNSRSNYAVACEVALAEGLISSRFALVASALAEASMDEKEQQGWISRVEGFFRLEQYLSQHTLLRQAIEEQLASEDGAGRTLAPVIEQILERMDKRAPSLFSRGARRKSDFFRDIAGSQYLRFAEEISQSEEVSFDQLVAHYDRAILKVENTPAGSKNFLNNARAAVRRLKSAPAALEKAVEQAGTVALDQVMSVGTGYGRQTLPFPKEQIRSEILCHGLGAHTLFPNTRTVLDIGGQDTKAIQVDERGIVTSFQMNDRCAAGCGRYLGYIADEMNLGLHELGPLANQSTRKVKINSTCTVFAGAELRERLSLGEKREDILQGLHRAVILRAMSLLARSGGVEDEFTFTGGVANNQAAVGALAELIQENYGERTLNISANSIYTGALGAAIFARRDWQQSVN